MEKIWLSHEPEVLAMAYQALNEAFVPPQNEEITNWLNEKTQYILGFIDKWAKPVLNNPQPFCQIVRYEEINQFIVATLKELVEFQPGKIKKRIKEFVTNDSIWFRPRQDPFFTPSERLTTFTLDKRKIFTSAADNIISLAPQGLFINDEVV